MANPKSQMTDVATPSVQLAARGWTRSRRPPCRASRICTCMSSVYMWVCTYVVCGSRIASRANYKGILDKTRCTYDEMEFYAPWNAQKYQGERDSLTVSGLRAKGKIRGFLEHCANGRGIPIHAYILGYFDFYRFLKYIIYHVNLHLENLKLEFFNNKTIFHLLWKTMERDRLVKINSSKAW